MLFLQFFRCGLYDWGILLAIPLELQEITHQPFPMARPFAESPVMGCSFSSPQYAENTAFFFSFPLADSMPETHSWFFLRHLLLQWKPHFNYLKFKMVFREIIKKATASLPLELREMKHQPFPNNTALRNNAAKPHPNRPLQHSISL